MLGRTGQRFGSFIHSRISIAPLTVPYYTQTSSRIVISKCLERHSKAKRRAPAYSRALRQIKGQSIVNSVSIAATPVPLANSITQFQRRTKLGYTLLERLEISIYKIQLANN